MPPPHKKRKVSHNSKDIQRLEEDVTSSLAKNTSLNSLSDLVDLAWAVTEPQTTSKAIYAVYRVFVCIISSERLSLFGGGGDAGADAKVVKSWIWERLNSYTDLLVGLLKDEEKALRISALQILFSLQKHLSTASSKQSSTPQFHISHFRKIVSGLLNCPTSPRRVEKETQSDGIIDRDVLDLFYEKWFSVYDDVRWFFLREAGSLLAAASSSNSDLPANVLSILERLTTFPTEASELNAWWITELGAKPKPKSGKDQEDDEPEEEGSKNTAEDDEDDWRKFFDDEPVTKDMPKKPGVVGRQHTLTLHQSLHSLGSHRAVFTRAWLTLLPTLFAGSKLKGDKLSATEQGRSNALVIRALNVMHRGVLPHLTRAVLVMDWVGECVDLGGTPGLLALNALWVLMKEYNLDYPSFYTRLYAFLDRDVLHVKHRSRFFRLTELFLSSTHLPANLLASFIKRLSRLSLNAPPAAIVMIIPFTYNVLKRHPALMVMIHRAPGDEAAGTYLPEEPNPLMTNAISSSLWELHSHRNHYHSAVSSLAKMLEEAFTKPSYAMEDFLDSTYGTLLESDFQRKIKKEPALAMDIGKKVDLFQGDGETGDAVTELWSFG